MSEKLKRMKIDAVAGNDTITGTVESEYGTRKPEVFNFKIATKCITPDSRLCILTDRVETADLFRLGVCGRDACNTINQTFIHFTVIEKIVDLLDRLAGEEACGISEVAIAKALAEKYGKEYEDVYLLLHYLMQGYIYKLFVAEMDENFKRFNSNIRIPENEESEEA